MRIYENILLQSIALDELNASSEMTDLKVNLFPISRGVIRLRI